jgi:hypothetical protein
METIITKRIKGSTMEAIFDSSNINVRYYKNLNLFFNAIFDPEKVYTFEIKIRHNEDQEPKQLLEQAIKNLTPCTHQTN